jgi:hypothetical protein
MSTMKLPILIQAFLTADKTGGPVMRTFAFQLEGDRSTDLEIRP